jgi:carbon starvation protein
MNTIILIAAATLVFVFGHRFYAKFLASAVFQFHISIGPGTGTRPQAATAEHHWLMILGQHFGVVATALTVSTTGVALVWGWFAAFLWIVAGTVIAGGTFSMGSLWLANRHPGQGLGTILQSYFRPRLWNAVLLLSLIVLLLLSAALLSTTAQLLVDHPSAVLPFWFQLLIALAIGQFLAPRPARALLPGIAAILAATVFSVWLLGKLPVGFSGVFNFDIGGASLLTLNAPVAWTLLLLVYLYFAHRLPPARLLRPRAFLASLQVALVVLILLAGAMFYHPDLTASQHQAPENVPGMLPWLLITITGGALSGIYLLFSNTFTGPQLGNEGHIRTVGYGTAIAEGLLAVSAVVVCAAGFDSASTWRGFYADWHSLLDPNYLLELYINGVVYFAGAFRLGAEFAGSLAAVALAGLSLTTLEASIRLLQAVVNETGKRTRIEPLERPRTSLRLVVLAIGWIGLSQVGTATPSHWMLFGSANQVLAGLGLLVMVAALERRQQPSLLLLGPLLLLVPATLWGLAAQLGYWWREGAWLAMLTTLVLTAITIWVLAETVQLLRRPAGTDSGPA